MKKLVISPQAGLGNRLRTLCSAKILGSLVGRDVFHYWVKDSERSILTHVNYMKDLNPLEIFNLDIPLYDGNAVDVCFTEWLPGDFWYREQSTAQSRMQCGEVVCLSNVAQIMGCSAETILIEASLDLRVPEFDPTLWMSTMSGIYSRSFPLNSKWLAIYRNLPSFDYGIAVRRGDFLDYHPDANIDVATICSRIETYQGSKIILCSDIEFRSAVRKSAGCPASIEANASGLDHDICEFLALSKCRTVVGTRGSSYAEQAALYGDRRYRAL